MVNHSLLCPIPMPASFIYDDKAEEYRATRAFAEYEIIQAAKSILNRRFRGKHVFNHMKIAKEFFLTELSALECEVFCVAFLTSSLQVIACEQMFRGSICSASVFPREVVKRALALNAATVIFAHNHPGGNPKASKDDVHITRKLVQALALVDIEVKDHLIVCGTEIMSFAENGLPLSPR